MVFNGAFNDISVLSLKSTLLVEETGVLGVTDLSQVTEILYHIMLFYYITVELPKTGLSENRIPLKTGLSENRIPLKTEHDTFADR
jgi:hypothetical protein